MPQPLNPMFMMCSKWIFCVLLLAASLPACVSNPQPDIPQDAVVNYETIRSAFPNEDTDSELPDLAETNGQTLTLRAHNLVGDLSETRAGLLDTMRRSNATLFHVIGLLELTVKTTPTVVTEDHIGWLLVGARRTARFTLNPQAEAVGEDKRFGYRFEIQPTFNPNNLPFRTVLEGYFDRAPKQTEPNARTGQGLLRFDFDTLRALDTDAPAGQLALGFRRRGGVLQVSGILKGVQFDRLAESRFSRSDYAIFQDGSGEFSFVASGDLSKDGKPFEKISVKAVWNAQGAGRAAIYSVGGSIPEGVVFLIDECWAEDGRTVWLQSAPALPDYTGGSKDACAPDLRDLTLIAPPPQAPDPGEDPLIPGPHPREVAE